MVDVYALNKLIARAESWGRGRWADTGINIAAAARRERVAHVAAELERLAYPALAAELLRQENAPGPRVNITPAA